MTKSEVDMTYICSFHFLNTIWPRSLSYYEINLVEGVRGTRVQLVGWLVGWTHIWEETD